MGLDDDNIAHNYKHAAPSPSAPGTSRNTMFWGLSQRIGSTGRQLTETLSAQSERQARLIQAITNSHEQFVREQGERLTRIHSGIEQNQLAIAGLQNATESLAVNQQHLTSSLQRLTANEQRIRTLKADVETLKQQVRVLQQQQRQLQQGKSASVLQGPGEENRKFYCKQTVMELDPTSEKGKRLTKVLSNWTSKSPDLAQDLLARVFLMHAFKMENQDAFVDALYGQGVLDESHLHLAQEERPKALSRLRIAISTSMNSSRVKELIVALEWSKNEVVLAEILKWAEDVGSKQFTLKQGSTERSLYHSGTDLSEPESHTPNLKREFSESDGSAAEDSANSPHEDTDSSKLSVIQVYVDNSAAGNEYEDDEPVQTRSRTATKRARGVKSPDGGSEVDSQGAHTQERKKEIKKPKLSLPNVTIRNEGSDPQPKAETKARKKNPRGKRKHDGWTQEQYDAVLANCPQQILREWKERVSNLRVKNAVQAYMWATTRDSFQLLLETAKNNREPFDIIEVGGAIDAFSDLINKDIEDDKSLDPNVMNMWDVFPSMDLFYEFNIRYAEYFPAPVDDERNQSPEFNWCSMCQDFWGSKQMRCHIKENHLLKSEQFKCGEKSCKYVRANKQNVMKHMEELRHFWIILDEETEAIRGNSNNRSGQARVNKNPVLTVVDVPRKTTLKGPNFEGELIPKEYFEQLKRRNEWDFTQAGSG